MSGVLQLSVSVKNLGWIYVMIVELPFREIQSYRYPKQKHILKENVILPYADHFTHKRFA